MANFFPHCPGGHPSAHQTRPGKSISSHMASVIPGSTTVNGCTFITRVFCTGMNRGWPLVFWKWIPRCQQQLSTNYKEHMLSATRFLCLCQCLCQRRFMPVSMLRHIHFFAHVMSISLPVSVWVLAPVSMYSFMPCTCICPRPRPHPRPRPRPHPHPCPLSTSTNTYMSSSRPCPRSHSHHVHVHVHVHVYAKFIKI